MINLIIEDGIREFGSDEEIFASLYDRGQITSEPNEDYDKGVPSTTDEPGLTKIIGSLN